MRSSSFDSASVEIFNRRLKIVTLCVIAVFAVLMLRLWFLQILNGPRYRVQSENNRIHLQDIPPFRGMIFDRNGELLVDNRPSYNLYIIPEEIQDREQLLKSLKLLTGLDPESVQIKFDESSHKYPFKPILIKRNMSRSELAVIETNLFNLPGVMIQVNPQRHYIFGSFASHLIGYLGEISESQLDSGKYDDNKAGDLIGKYGVEGEWQKVLHGFRGGEQVEVDAAGRKLRVISRKRPMPGLNVWLTIDTNLQMMAETGLEGKTGAIVAINPNNGEILALASSPAFDPNLFIGGMERAEWERIISSKDSPLQNRPISGQYPPGSVFKIVVALAGLEEGIIDPQEEIICTGSYRVGNHTSHCWREHGHGKVSFHRALVESCDVYFYKTGQLLGVDKIAHYARMLGLGKKTDFDLGSERAGLIPTRRWKLKRWGVPWQAGETVSMAIGQSFVLVTPLQMVRTISAIFNGGHIYKPKAIKWVGKDDIRVYQFKPTLMDQIKANQENIELIKNALKGVINEPHGTGSRAKIKGMTVAGKTGTAQLIAREKIESLDEEAEIPLEFRDHAWFVAIAPVESPTLALAILIEHGGHGGSAAAPIAKEMIKAYFAKN
ncbi:MAG: penicillin-binding protein 2 [Deltaproteobacteria bacterium]|nr:MAG: penicillin-binding protein 2 [Deltaproteobacteria bacterium]